MKKRDRKSKSTSKRATKDLPPRGRSVKAGSVSNVLKLRHDTAKNSIGN